MQAVKSSSLKVDHATKAYYDRHAKKYADATRNVDMSDLYAEFLRHVLPGGRILDAGSGSGRDTLAFLKSRYDVDAFDSSAALAALSTELTGNRTQVVCFQEFDSPPCYEGIWACASLVHVPISELPDALGRLIRALKPGGVLYLSVKHGTVERLAADGRLFVDLDEARLRRLFEPFPEATLGKIWISKGEGSHRGKDEWLNALVHKLGQRGTHD